MLKPLQVKSALVVKERSYISIDADCFGLI